MKILCTGVAGFIGSHLADMCLARGYEVIGIDAYLEGSNWRNIPEGAEVHNQRAEHFTLECAKAICPDAIINVAALSNVDTSIKDPRAFESNISSTSNMANIAMLFGIPLVHVSTDEVYGPFRRCQPAGRRTESRGFDEEASFKPTSAYAASKAASELMAMSYFKTFGADVRVTRGANTYGTRQQDKLIPTIVKKAISGAAIPIFKTPAKREWLHVLDHCSAILAVLEKGRAGEVYNVSSGESRSPVEIAKLLAPQSKIEYIEDRKGYDLEYKIDSSKIRAELGWSPQFTVDEQVPYLYNWYNRAFLGGYFD